MSGYDRDEPADTDMMALVRRYVPSSSPLDPRLEALLEDERRARYAIAEFCRTHYRPLPVAPYYTPTHPTYSYPATPPSPPPPLHSSTEPTYALPDSPSQPSSTYNTARDTDRPWWMDGYGERYIGIENHRSPPASPPEDEGEGGTGRERTPPQPVVLDERRERTPQPVGLAGRERTPQQPSGLLLRAAKKKRQPLAPP